MASRQQIKGRIKSVKSTRQITKAMELVAASKMRRAQDAAQKPEQYARLARQMMTRLRQLEGADEFSWFRSRQVNHRYIVVIASNLGLAGAYDGNVIRQLIKEITEDRKKGIRTSVICVGRKVARAVARFKDVNIVAIYDSLPEHPSSDDLRPILTQVIDEFISEATDAVDILYTHFHSTVRTEVRTLRLLPAGFRDEALSDELANAEAEPSSVELLEIVTVQLLESQLYQSIVESFASEQSMRMLAMKNATDNAGDIIEDLTLEFNNARQAAITQELAEISGGAEAIS